MPDARENHDRDHPSGSTAGIAVAGLALIGALALVAATFIDVIVVSAGARTLSSDSGYARHSVALIVLAVAAVLLTIITFQRGSRTAALGLAVVGVAALLIAILGDVPDLGRTGAYEQFGLSASTKAGGGFYAETVGGVLLLFSGGWLFLTGSGNARPVPAR